MKHILVKITFLSALAGLGLLGYLAYHVQVQQVHEEYQMRDQVNRLVAEVGGAEDHGVMITVADGALAKAVARWSKHLGIAVPAISVLYVGNYPYGRPYDERDYWETANPYRSEISHEGPAGSIMLRVCLIRALSDRLMTAEIGRLLIDLKYLSPIIRPERVRGSHRTKSVTEQEEAFHLDWQEGDMLYMKELKGRAPSTANDYLMLWKTKLHLLEQKYRHEKPLGRVRQLLDVVKQRLAFIQELAR